MKRTHPGGFVSYYMKRMVKAGEMRFVLHLSPSEVGLGRTYVARRLRQFRRDIQDATS